MHEHKNTQSEVDDSIDRAQVFVCYARADAEWLKQLRVHLHPLVRQGIRLWTDAQIGAGQNWREEIDHALRLAQVAVLLLTPHFVASEFINQSELPRLLEEAHKGGTVILWMYLEPCLYDEVEGLTRFQAINPTDQPLSGLSRAQQSEFFVKLARRIKEVLSEQARARAEEERKAREAQQSREMQARAQHDQQVRAAQAQQQQRLAEETRAQQAQRFHALEEERKARLIRGKQAQAEQARQARAWVAEGARRLAQRGTQTLLAHDGQPWFRRRPALMLLVAGIAGIWVSVWAVVHKRGLAWGTADLSSASDLTKPQAGPAALAIAPFDSASLRLSETAVDGMSNGPLFHGQGSAQSVDNSGRPDLAAVTTKALPADPVAARPTPASNASNAPTGSAGQRRPRSANEPSKRPEETVLPTLTVLVRPWAVIYADGKLIKQTPLRNYKMSPGRHTIMLVNDMKGKRETISINAELGRNVQINRIWD